MSEDKKPPPEDEYSAFKELLDKIAKVPKAEVDKAAEKYRDDAQKKKA